MRQPVPAAPSPHLPRLRAARRARQWRQVTRPIITTVAFTFVAYLLVGLPLAVLPPFVHGPLGYSSVLAGLSVSAQYLATFLTRAPIGRMTDTVGPKQMVILGLGACGLSGVFTLAAGLTASNHPLSLTLVLIGRLCLGTGESGVATGALSWAIGKVGPSHSAKIISYNGIGTYAALAIAAPLGVLIDSLAGLAAIGGIVILIALGALPFAMRGPVVHRTPGPQMSFGRVFTRILPHGAALALGSIGFGAIASFITLDYASQGWPHAALALTAFGLCFILARLLFVGSIPRFGGSLVAIVCFLVEGSGLMLLWLATGPTAALIGAGIAGFGFAVVFPALGVEVLDRVPPTNRGAALGVFSVFLDVALGVTGPLAGALVGGFGYAAIFLAAAIAAFIACVIAIILRLKATRRLA